MWKECYNLFNHGEAGQSEKRPVSYTHLDVYKRQVYDIIMLQKEEIQPVKANTRKSEMIRKIVGFVEENYTQRIVLNSLAAYLSVSEGYLCRFFRENFHMTFVEYVQPVSYTHLLCQAGGRGNCAYILQFRGKTVGSAGCGNCGKGRYLYLSKG